MRLVRRPQPDPTTCRRYADRSETSGADGPPNAAHDRYEAKATMAQGETPRAAIARIRGRLLAYDIFPPSAIRAHLCPSGPIREGTTIVQWARVGLVWIETAVRVIEVWDGDSNAGFSYVTLAGHPEKGIATFGVERRGDEIWLVMTASSRPGTLLTEVGRPLARRMQKRLTRQALQRLSMAGRD